jgi:hypothetical protein
MQSIHILGQEIPITFASGQVEDESLRQELISGVENMAALINAKTWTRAYADALRIMREIVFFDQSVTVNGYLMERPGCDEDDAIFYWEVSEFLANRDDDVHANTLFHDCWHVVQFRGHGNRYANGLTERIEREVDAVDQQIAVAALLGCDEPEIRYLRDFRDNQQRIIARLDEGVNGIGPIRHA